MRRRIASWLRALADQLDPSPKTVMTITAGPPGAEERIEAAFRAEMRRLRNNGWML
ncbi:hypothetical protein [Planobispora rosea]|uniref:hypothetical protein n=1 Tax=Planobispora rosea TaxID=35762 RepID=UPI00159F326A|nr:hypothetical protein [Planobispora rosea]